MNSALGFAGLGQLGPALHLVQDTGMSSVCISVPICGSQSRRRLSSTRLESGV